MTQAANTPVPDSPISSIHENSSGHDGQVTETGQESESTESLGTDQESQDPNMEPVYNVSIFENGYHSDVFVEDLNTVWPEQDDLESACAPFAFEMPRQQLPKLLKKPDMFLPCFTVAPKKSQNEVKYSELAKGEKEMFQQAKQKKLKCWLDTNTVQAILRDRIHPTRIMSSRWILTWKGDPQEPSSRKAKARLVVKGFQDPDIGTLNSDNPTMTRDSRMLLLQAVSSHQWMVQGFDITTTFLRGRPRTSRGSPNGLMGMSENHVCLLKGNACGRVLFYREFRGRLEDVGFSAHPLDNCLFLLRNKKEHIEKALNELQKTLPFGTREYGRLKFTGLDIEQLPDYSIKSKPRKVHPQNCTNRCPETEKNGTRKLD